MNNLFVSLNTSLLFSVAEAVESGEFDQIESWGFDLPTAQRLTQMSVRDLLRLANSTHSLNRLRLGDGRALARMMTSLEVQNRVTTAVDGLIQLGATAAMIQSIYPEMDYVDHALKRRLFGIERHKGRPCNVSDLDLERVGDAWVESDGFEGSLPERLLELCRVTELRADRLWSALRQWVCLLSPDTVDPVLQSLALPQSEDTHEE